MRALALLFGVIFPFHAWATQPDAPARTPSLRAAASQAARAAYGAGARVSRRPLFQGGTTVWLQGATAYRVLGTDQIVLVQRAGRQTRTFTADLVNLDPHRSPATLQVGPTRNPIVVIRAPSGAMTTASASEPLIDLGASFTKRHHFLSLIAAEPSAKAQIELTSYEYGQRSPRERTQTLEITYGAR